MSLIGRRREPLTLEDMAQMTATVAAYYLGPLHSKCVVHMPRHRARNRIEIRGPTAARLEFVTGFIERGFTAGTGIYALRWVVRIVFASSSTLGTFLSKDSELFYSYGSFSYQTQLQWPLRSCPLESNKPGLSTALHWSSLR